MDGSLTVPTAAEEGDASDELSAKMASYGTRRDVTSNEGPVLMLHLMETRKVGLWLRTSLMRRSLSWSDFATGTGTQCGGRK